MQPETQLSDVSVSPSFNTYSSAADVAARVSLEDLRPDLSRDAGGGREEDEEEEEDDDFEFVSLSANPDGEFFIDGGGIRPIFPVFNRDLLSDRQRDAEEPIRIPLKRLFLHDRDPPASSSSSAERIKPGTYCFWTPRLEEPSPRLCEKSNSTGSSATSRRSRWSRFRDLLKRSNSEGGKGSSLVFLTPTFDSAEKGEKGGNSKEKKPKGKVGESKTASAHEKLYVRNRKMKEEDKRRSYLPYRQDLVGFFANVNGLGGTFLPF